MPKKTNGTVRQRPDGRWEARATIGGKRVSFYAERQSEALRAMRAAQKAEDDGMYFEPSRVTVAAWLDTWLTEYAAPSIKPLSREPPKLAGSLRGTPDPSPPIRAA